MIFNAKKFAKQNAYIVCNKCITMLCDWQISYFVHQHYMDIEPFVTEQLQPNSYDVRLSKNIKVISKNYNRNCIIDPYLKYDNLWTSINIPDSGYVIYPGECVLGSTVEKFRIPSNICARVEGKSSLGRYFIGNHITAGFIDSGFVGNITLEIKNNFELPFKLYPNMLIGQIAFDENMDKEHCLNTYHGKYQHQSGATESYYHKNKK